MHPHRGCLTWGAERATSTGLLGLGVTMSKGITDVYTRGNETLPREGFKIRMPGEHNVW